MGIPGLWTMMKEYSTDTCLIEYSALEGVRNVNANVRGLRVGIDISPWLFQATAPSHRHQSKNIALASIFKHYTTLFGSTTVIPIFVFDDDTKALLDALGFAHHEAPGEAEAELAWMSANDIIDAVWTEDSDAFVFGATRVFRLQQSEDDTVSLKLTDITGGDYSPGVPNCGIKEITLAC
ncbi:PIN domain-like protein [Hymenopellis radicata]|nr:PIN domain-like protein [Hymenopellis radicata]